MHAIALLVAVVLAQASAAQPSAPAEPEPFPFTAASEPTAEQAYQFLLHDRSADAVPLVEEVVRENPENPRAYRLEGRVYLEQHRNDDAIHAYGRALDLGIDPRRRDDVISGRARAYLAQDNFGAALDEVRPLLGEPSHDRDHGEALVVAGIAAGRLRRAQEASEFAGRLARIGTDTAATHVLLAEIYANVGELERAHEEVTRARRLGAQDPALDQIEGAYTSEWRESLWWKIPVGSAIFLVATLLLFFLSGLALSRFEVAHLASVNAGLLREDRTLAERIVDGLYNAVLWYGTALFYVSIPAMLALMIATSGGLVYLMLQMGRIDLRLLLIVVIAGGAGVISVIRGVFGAMPKQVGATPRTAAEEPVLFDTLAEVAKVAGSKPVDRVEIEAGTSIGVREEGGTLGVLFGGGERVLTLGYGAVMGLTVGELKSILAHEYGHFSHGETRLSPVIWRLRTTLVRVLMHMASQGYARLNPVFWYLRAYFYAYLKVTLAQSRRRELMADRTAALTYGGDVFAVALAKVIELEDFMNRTAVSLVSTLRQTGRIAENLYAPLAEVYATVPASLRALRTEPLLSRKADAFDSHPAPRDRMARVAGIAPAREPESAPARTLFADAEETGRRLTAQLVDRVQSALETNGVRFAPKVDGDAEGTAKLAVAIGRYYDTLEAVEHKQPDADVSAREALAAIETTWGDGDFSTLMARLEMARTRVRVGDDAGAIEVLERAASALTSITGGESAASASYAKVRLAEVNKMLEQVRAKQNRAPRSSAAVT